MPEAVRTYVETEDLTQVDTVLDRIIRDLHNDFAHHAEPKDIVRIGWIWDSVPKQLAKDNNKFVFSHVREGTRARDLEDSLNRIMPLEVKSADNTRAKSLATYCRQYKPELAFKVSAKNIGDNQKGDTHEIRLPLYLLWRLPVYIGEVRN